MSGSVAALPVLAQGLFWQQLSQGARFRTFRRLITEADLVAFISCTGMLESIFIDPEFEGRAIAGRPVPAALTYTLIEGFQLQSICQGTGLALLEVSMKAHCPVQVCDTISAIVTIESIRPTSRGGRAVVTSFVEVYNQDETLVLSYRVSRLIAGQPLRPSTSIWAADEASP